MPKTTYLVVHDLVFVLRNGRIWCDGGFASRGLARSACGQRRRRCDANDGLPSVRVEDLDTCSY